MLFTNSTAVFTASSPVFSPLITSTRAMTGTGLKKCIPRNISGLSVAFESSVMLRPDVLVASSAFELCLQTS